MRRQPSLMLLWLAATGCSHAETPAPPVPAHRVRVLHKAHQELARALAPNQYHQSLALVRQRLRVLAPAILESLANREGPTFAAAADLAAELHMTSALELLREAVNDVSASHRSVALRAANRIRAIPTPELVALLDDSDGDLQVEVLRALAGRGGVSFATLAPMLDDADPRLAGAAAGALPAELTVEESAALATLQFGSPQAAVAVIETLARRPLPAVVVKAWLHRLRGQPVEVQRTILAVVRAQPDSIADWALLRVLVVDNVDPCVGFEALDCLVRARSAEPEWLLARSEDLPRPHQILCALGLLQRGRNEGARLLYELAFGQARPSQEPVQEEGNAGSEPAAEVDAVAVTARELLSRLANLPLHVDPEAFATWSARPTVVRADALVFRGSAATLFPSPSAGTADWQAHSALVPASPPR